MEEGIVFCLFVCLFVSLNVYMLYCVLSCLFTYNRFDESAPTMRVVVVSRRKIRLKTDLKLDSNPKGQFVRFPSRVARFFLTQYTKTENIMPNYQNYYQITIKCTKGPYYIPKDHKICLHFLFYVRPSQKYPNWDFGIENVPSGNPVPVFPLFREMETSTG
jgi:hypothetical protein